MVIAFASRKVFQAGGEKTLCGLSYTPKCYLPHALEEATAALNLCRIICSKQTVPCIYTRGMKYSTYATL